ncbi:Os01g0901550 [Oryza sativa Japonica Group]|uniref:Os01g0901550 protein n=1 Tax=Oryza sativa subsp. japonica TaxID=39947 RepID=A0A0N7KE90_ORYSJ|nr:hypothetical protein EE612_007416 [Oryza sativa]BAS75753.1 Os01g0901550 [Oryza sativa Japonica Group]
MTCSLVIFEPGCLTMKAIGSSPASSSGYGITAASAIPGWDCRICSSSAGVTWYPLYFINSFSRSTMYRKPSSLK